MPLIQHICCTAAFGGSPDTRCDFPDRQPESPTRNRWQSGSNPLLFRLVKGLAVFATMYRQQPDCVALLNGEGQIVTICKKLDYTPV